MSRIVVFGGAGFLGSHVADRLTTSGHRVVVFDRQPSPYLSEGQEMIIGDIMDRMLVRNVVCGADYVYHFAAIADIAEAKNNPIVAAEFNIMGTMFILDACREFAVKRIIYASTIYVYSDHGSFYRSTKQACELFIENYHSEYGLEFCVLRYGSLYGPRANRFNFIRNAIIQALTERKIVRNGDGSELRDYIHIVDAAEATEKAMGAEYRNSYLMITGHQSMTVRDLLFMIKEILDNKIDVEFLSAEMPGHYKITPYSFRPQVALKVVPDDFRDLGQGILDSIYEIYQELYGAQANLPRS